MKPVKDINQRFWEKVRIRTPFHCWEWSASLGTGNVARFSVNGKPRSAARWVFFHLHPEASSRLFVLHNCDNSKCVNPFHLYLGTQKDNVRDMISRGRRNCPPCPGEENGGSVLTSGQVLEIRRRHKPGNGAMLAREFGVCKSMISNIVLRRNWRHL
jgi:hypothetical protein